MKNNKLLIAALIVSLGVNIGIAIAIFGHYRHFHDLPFMRHAGMRQHEMRHCGWGGMMNQVGLTQEQFNGFRKIRIKTIKKIMPLRHELDEKRHELFKILITPKPDKKIVAKKIHAIGAVHEKILMEIINALDNVKSTLSPEQTQLFIDLFEKRFEKVGWRPGKHPGPFNWRQNHRYEP